MRILIAGDREWTDNTLIRSVIDELVKQYGKFTLIEGGAKGVDSIATHIAKYVYQLHIEEYAAEWEKLGKKAGPIRNKRMLAEGKPDLVIVFHNDLEGSKGTRNMFYISGIAKIPRVWYTEQGKQYDERDK